MGASSITGTGHGSVERGLPPYRNLGQTLKLRGSDGMTPIFTVITDSRGSLNYVAKSGGTSPPIPSSAYHLAFTNSNLVVGVLTVTHNLNVLYVAGITVYDNENNVILSDEITPLTANSLSINLTTYDPIVGTWNLVIIP